MSIDPEGALRTTLNLFPFNTGDKVGVSYAETTVLSKTAARTFTRPGSTAETVEVTLTLVLRYSPPQNEKASLPR